MEIKAKWKRRVRDENGNRTKDFREDQEFAKGEGRRDVEIKAYRRSRGKAI